MAVRCEAKFNERGLLYAGQTISGTICLSLEERILVKAIILKVSGFAQAEWNSAKKEKDKPAIVKGREDFIATTTYLVGSEHSTSVLVSPGTYNYSFSCAIPDSSPSTFNAICGHIRYQLSVVLSFENRSEEIVRETFQVSKPLDLRPLTGELKIPAEVEVFESKLCFEYWKTPLSLFVNIPQSGYIPGETISVYARLINDGNVPLQHLAISFNQVVTFTSKVPRQISLVERYNIVQKLNSLAGNECIREFLERIGIPCVPPTCDKASTIIQISYEVEVLAEQTNGKRGVVARIPILIGTIPIGDFNEKNDLKMNLNSETSSYKSTAFLSASSMENVAVSSSDVLSKAPAPTSFQEAEFMSSANLNKDDKHVMNKDVSGFKPKYLYYEINEDIEMTPTTMEITKEITIAST